MSDVFVNLKKNRPPQAGVSVYCWKRHIPAVIFFRRQKDKKREIPSQGILFDLIYIVLLGKIFKDLMRAGVGKLNRRPLFYLFFFLIIIQLSSCSSTRKIKNQRINQVVDTAKSFRGTPYRYGGTTRSGIDCSALVFLSFQSAGINLPRTSAEQSKVGKKVSVHNLEKGDVIFFATGKRRRKVTHAGIVTSARRGNIQFIHSSTSLGVTEDNVYSPYWSQRVVRARRIF